MKISRLFHWLYAILMLLPFAFFVPSVLYYAFNDNATMQSVEVPKTETISVDFNQLVRDDSYTYSVSGVTWTYEDYYLTIDIQNNVDLYVQAGIGIYNLTENHTYLCRSNFGVQGTNLLIENYFTGHSSTAVGDYIFTTGTTYINNVHLFSYIPRGTPSGIYQGYLQLFDLTQMFGSGNEPTIIEFNQLFPNSYYPYTESELMQITYETGETEQLIENTSIINYAWESIWDLPLFSWTKVTFVSVPFSYLTGIFGIGASNSLNYVFGYFVTISIVWLVFDLLLYVPMLAHNWIDKARIE